MARTKTNDNIEVDPEMVYCRFCELLTHTTLLKTATQVNPADTDDATSGYDTGSTSISSTVNEYVFENGICPLLQIYHSYANTEF
jgi:hypothetical protein